MPRDKGRGFFGVFLEDRLVLVSSLDSRRVVIGLVNSIEALLFWFIWASKMNGILSEVQTLSEQGPVGMLQHATGLKTWA